MHLAAFDSLAAEKQFYLQHRIYDAQIRILQKRRPTESLNELDMREMESKIQDAKLNCIFPCLAASFEEMSAKMGWLQAYADAKCVECDRLKRLLRRVKKS